VAYFDFVWTNEIVQHLAEHRVKPEDFEEVVSYPDLRATSRSSGRPCCWAELEDGRYILCVYEYLDDNTFLPVTAYEMPMPGEGVD